VQPGAVVKANNVVGNIVCSLGVIGVVLLPNPLHLQIQEEALHHSVIPTIAFAAHTAYQAMFGK
jgi:energy-converting hydrogenase Eha subunit C